MSLPIEQLKQAADRTMRKIVGLCNDAQNAMLYTTCGIGNNYNAQGLEALIKAYEAIIAEIERQENKLARLGPQYDDRD